MILVLSVGTAQPAPAQTAPSSARLSGWYQSGADSLPKSLEAAAFVNLLVPFGAGSFYAGNSRHGVRHLTIGVGSLVAVGIANHRLSRDDDEAGSLLLWVGGALGFLGNWVWGTVTAVGDARAYNRRAMSGVDLSPLVLSLASLPAGGTSPEARRFGVGFRIGF